LHSKQYERKAKKALEAARDPRRHAYVLWRAFLRKSALTTQPAHGDNNEDSERD
jgi:hypothetical protein